MSKQQGQADDRRSDEDRNDPTSDAWLSERPCARRETFGAGVWADAPEAALATSALSDATSCRRDSLRDSNCSTRLSIPSLIPIPQSVPPSRSRTMVVDHIKYASEYFNLSPGIRLALEYLQRVDAGALEAGRHDVDGDRVFALVSDYLTRRPEDAFWEAHRHHVRHA